MRIAKQEDVDRFYMANINNTDIYPYFTTSTFIKKKEVSADDWQGLFFIGENDNYLLNVSFDRTRGIEFNISLYALNPFAAGKAVLVVKELINRYKPRAINSVVHSSNFKSIKLHTKIFGLPWGTEPLIAWNMAKGEYEHLHYFRKLL